MPIFTNLYVKHASNPPHNKRMQRTAKPIRALSAADSRRYAALKKWSVFSLD
jgi:hypothetical protein